MLSRFRSRRSAITFDLGRAGIRVYQLQSRGPHLEVCDSLRLEFPPNGRPQENDGPGSDLSRLARLVGQGDFRGRDVAVVLSAADVQFHALRLPEQVLNEDEERLRAALEWEVSRQTRGEPQELEVRYWRLPPSHHQGLNVMAVSMPTARSVEWFELFAKHHLHLRRLDVTPCAIVRLAGQMWTPADNELWGVLDLGCHHTNLTVVVGTAPTYARTISGSADQWTQGLAAALDVPHATAERLKREHGIEPGERGVRRSPRQPAPERLDEAALPGVFFGLLRGSLNGLIQDINRCFSYVLQNFADLSVSRLLLAGGGADLRGLAGFLGLQLGLSVIPLSSRVSPGDDAWQVPLPGVEFGPVDAAALGGALLDLEAA